MPLRATGLAMPFIGVGFPPSAVLLRRTGSAVLGIDGYHFRRKQIAAKAPVKIIAQIEGSGTGKITPWKANIMFPCSGPNPVAKV